MENGKIDDWRNGIFGGFSKIIGETYDKVGPNAGFAPDSERGRLHENGQDIYETTWQEAYRNVKKVVGES